LIVKIHRQGVQKTDHVALDLENSPGVTKGDHVGVVGNDPLHYEAHVMMNNLNNKVDSHRPCGFDCEESPQGVQRRIMQIDLENSPGITKGDHIGVVRNGPKDLGHYYVYIVSRSLEGGLGVALIDTGSQVSLVKAASLVKYRQEKGKNLHLTFILRPFKFQYF
jgi:hypothetical protein